MKINPVALTSTKFKQNSANFLTFKNISFRGDCFIKSNSDESFEKRKELYCKKGINTREANELAKHKSDFSVLSVEERKILLEKLYLMKLNKLFSEQESSFLDIDAKIDDIIKNTLFITPLKISPDKREQFVNDFLVKSSYFDKVLSEADYCLYIESGIPLKYSRKDFLSDVEKVVNFLDFDKKSAIFKKMQINPLYSNGHVVGFDGIIKKDGLDDSNEIEAEILSYIEKFIFDNEIQTNDDKLNEVLTNLISQMPEYINVFQKAQHTDQKKTLDIHMLSAYKALLKDNRMNSFNDSERNILKTATLLHDIAKRQGIVDNTHPFNSALYAKDILNKYPLDDKAKRRIFSLIKNHHWLANYNRGILNAEKTAELFLDKKEWNMAQVLTLSDLAGGNSSIYMLFAPLLSDYRLQDITNYVK